MFKMLSSTFLAIVILIKYAEKVLQQRNSVSRSTLFLYEHEAHFCSTIPPQQ